MMRLPEEIAKGASLIGNEYGWAPSTFPNALLSAEQRRYACLGGQFQIRRESDVYEMYWINADSTYRHRKKSGQIVIGGRALRSARTLNA